LGSVQSSSFATTSSFAVTSSFAATATTSTTASYVSVAVLNIPDPYTSTPTVLRIVSLTSAEYTALSPKDSNTYYVVI
jgi:hypothetical protein